MQGQSLGCLKTPEIYIGDEGIRTPDFHVANVALSQLSYIPLIIIYSLRFTVASQEKFFINISALYVCN